MKSTLLRLLSCDSHLARKVVLEMIPDPKTESDDQNNGDLEAESD